MWSNRGELKAPDRIVVSLPPLGVAEQAFKIRDFVNRRAIVFSRRATVIHRSGVLQPPSDQSQTETAAEARRYEESSAKLFKAESNPRQVQASSARGQRAKAYDDTSAFMLPRHRLISF